VIGGLEGDSVVAFSKIWQDYQQDPMMQVMTHSIFMILTLWVVAKGVRHGLERASRIMLPLLFLSLLILAMYGATTLGFSEAWHFLFTPNFKIINADIVISALGHAFFTLAVGASALLVYGIYAPEDVSLPGTIFTIAWLDVAVALLAGMAIFPFVFTYHLPVTSGPGLMFQILPVAFSHVHHAWFLGPLFFSLLLFAAWTSSLSLAEPLVIYLIEVHHRSRRQASIAVGLLSWTLGLLSAFSENIFSHVVILHRSLFLLITDTATNFLLPVGGFGIILFTGYVLKREALARAMNLSGRWFWIWYGIMRTLTPLAIIAILIGKAW
jgi:NSS family neurotransmitter:Na+ symporter